MVFRCSRFQIHQCHIHFVAQVDFQPFNDQFYVLSFNGVKVVSSTPVRRIGPRFHGMGMEESFFWARLRILSSAVPGSGFPAGGFPLAVVSVLFGEVLFLRGTHFPGTVANP